MMLVGLEIQATDNVMKCKKHPPGPLEGGIVGDRFFVTNFLVCCLLKEKDSIFLC